MHHESNSRQRQSERFSLARQAHCVLFAAVPTAVYRSTIGTIRSASCKSDIRRERAIKVAIVGSRNASDELLQRCWEYVESLPLDTVIVSGGAVGIDQQAEDCAYVRGMQTIIIKPDWKRYGKSAGFRRNADIIAAADRVVAFTNGSKGTAHSIELARKAGKEVIVITF
jgi:DNA recombination-mediator protein A